MASLNKVMLIGNLGRDPEIRYMTNGDAVCNISIATTESWTDKGGNKQEKTEWHSIVLYRKLAEIASQYLKKGSSVYIEGKLQTRKWTDKESGGDRYVTEIVGEKLQMLGGRSDSHDSAAEGRHSDGHQNSRAPSQSNAQHQGDGSSNSQRAGQHGGYGNPNPPRPSSQPAPGKNDEDIDNIPF